MMKPGIYLGDCLEVMPNIKSGSIDMILCDLPYQVTNCEWDTIIPFEPLWEQYKRLIKPNGAIVLTAVQPFTTALINSNPRWFKHSWVWNKAQSGSFQNAKYQPLKVTEDVLIFGKERVNYYPIMRNGKFRAKGGAAVESEITNGLKPNYKTFSDSYYPTNILDFPACANKAENVHPTQKPVGLFGYLIRTYSKPDETVLDNCAGSGTTAIAAFNSGRRFICIENNPAYYAAACKRLELAQAQLRFEGMVG